MAKTKSRAASETVSNAPITRKSVDIKRANNGYVVSQWSNKGDKTYIAKTQKEAQTRAAKLLKM